MLVQLDDTCLQMLVVTPKAVEQCFRNQHELAFLVYQLCSQTCLQCLLNVFDAVRLIQTLQITMLQFLFSFSGQ